MSKRRKKLPTLPVTASIETLSHEGRGIARVNGKTTFIQGALPGETVTFQYTRQQKQFDEGRLLSIESPSSYRAAPICKFYDVCGGCSLQHMDSHAQIIAKETWLLDILERIGNVIPKKILPPLRSDIWHYRRKARLSVRYVQKKQSVLIGFRERHQPRYIADIDSCEILTKHVADAIGPLRCLLNAFSDPGSIAQIEVAAGDMDTALIFRHMQSLTTDDEYKLAQFAKEHGFRIYLQSHGPETIKLFYPQVINKPLSYKLLDDTIDIYFEPRDFTQIHSGLNRQMLKQALSLLDLHENDRVLDLFCGLGNFSLPISRYCHHVTGIEGCQMMVNRAQENAKHNGIENVAFYCANLEEEKSLSHINPGHFHKLLLDPPRTGAQAVIKQIHHIQPKQIVYVSCNPTTLARDAKILTELCGYCLQSAGVMDMFPHTAHVESMALFEKR